LRAPFNYLGLNSINQEGEMTAYVICEVRIKEHDQYAREVVPVFSASHKEYGGRLLARSDEPATFAGMPPGGRVVMLEFPDTDTVRRWWNSATVKAAIDRRDVLRINSLVAVEGVVT
jgi:uncharacterized protein (DUF1330 family)